MANTIQQLKMCEAFAEAGEEVAYVYPILGGEAASWEMLAEFFGLSTRFDLVTLPATERNFGFPNYPIPDMADQVLTYWLVHQYLSGGFDDGDIVYSRTLRPLRYLLLLRNWVGIGPDIHVWFEQHQVDRGLDEMVLGGRFYDQLDGVVCISDTQKRAMVDTQSIDPERIFVAHDGVDLDAYDGITSAAARDRLGIDADERVVTYTGHLYPSKGVETLVEAVGEVDCHCFVVGGYEEDVSRIRSTLDVPNNVTFTGFVSPSEIPSYQCAADVLVATVARDAETDYFSPLKLFEYMAAGKPIVVSRRPEFEEVLTHGRTAMFVEPGSVTSMAAAIDDLLADPARRSALGDRARDAAGQYDWTARAASLLREIRAGKRADEQPTPGGHPTPSSGAR